MRRYAEEAADTIISQGIPVHFFTDLVPTPLVAHAVKSLNCAAGIMITASHNPAEYNGYKVYYANGCQIIPPHDAGIAAMIEENLPLWKESSEEEQELLMHKVDPSVVDQYFKYLQVQPPHVGLLPDAEA
jgi:phosphomannomutase